MSDAAEFLTVRELADLLRVKERKIYQLVADGEVPCRKVTGKLLFPRAEIDAWLAGGQQAPVAAPGRRPAVVAGSHDPLLDWAIRESGSGLPTLFDGSLDGLARFAAGEASVAGLHIPEDEAEWNVASVRALGAGRNGVLIEWAWRERGLLVAPGNPGRIAGIADLAGKRLVARQDRSGSQILFVQLLAAAGLAASGLSWERLAARTETETADAIREGRADAGLGLAAVARQHGLDFVPLLKERFDLLVCRQFYFEPPFQRLLAFCREETFHRRAADLGGYDISGLGRVRDNSD